MFIRDLSFERFCELDAEYRRVMTDAADVNDVAYWLPFAVMSLYLIGA